MKTDQEKSLFSNSLFNIINSFFRLAFPVITFAYAMRCLGEEGVGKVNFSRSIVTWFSLLALLGMNQYGTREVSKRRTDRDILSKFVHEMLLISACTSTFAYALLLIAIQLIPKLQGYRALLLINSASILLQALGMEWLYQGVEEYEYIAKRSILFQFLAVLAMFILVKDAKDTAAYAAISMVSSHGVYLVNFIHVRKHVNFKWYGNYHLRQHIRPLLWLFTIAVSIELYTVLDSTMLGLLQSDAAVGRYTAAVKVNKMANMLITAVSAVIIPRLSFYIEQKNGDKVRNLVGKAYNCIFLLSVPAAVGLYMLSENIILLFSGDGFGTAAITMRILVPIVLLIPFSTVTNCQIFVPMGKEKLFLCSTFTGAATNLICNTILIPRFAENGAAIATVMAETAVAVVCFVNARNYFDMRAIFRRYHQYWLGALPIPFIVMAVDRLPFHYFIRMIIAVVFSSACYFALLLWQKNEYMAQVFQFLRKWRKK